MSDFGPLCFHVVDLPPAGVVISGEVPFHALGIEDREDDLTDWGGTMAYKLTIAPIGDGALVRGRLEGAVTRRCDRCLTSGTLSLCVPDVCHHFEHVEGRMLDLTEYLREDILLVFPQGYICRGDCRGLCPQCGCNLNDSVCDCSRRDVADDPWSALDSLEIGEIESG